VLHLPAPRGVHVRTVAFRHTQTVIDVIAVRSNLDVQNLNAERRKRSDE
jgi:hypothetical protein